MYTTYNMSTGLQGCKVAGTLLIGKIYKSKDISLLWNMKWFMLGIYSSGPNFKDGLSKWPQKRD